MLHQKGTTPIKSGLILTLWKEEKELSGVWSGLKVSVDTCLEWLKAVDNMEMGKES